MIPSWSLSGIDGLSVDLEQNLSLSPSPQAERESEEKREGEAPQVITVTPHP